MMIGEKKQNEKDRKCMLFMPSFRVSDIWMCGSEENGYSEISGYFVFRKQRIYSNG